MVDPELSAVKVERLVKWVEGDEGAASIREAEIKIDFSCQDLTLPPPPISVIGSYDPQIL